MQDAVQLLPFGLEGLLGQVTLGAAVGNGPAPVCYVEGTQILTDQGYVKIEALEVGAKVQTADGDLEPVVWTGHRSVEMSGEADHNRLAPVLIRAGALGPDTPFKDLYVSPAHTLYIDGVLVPAARLINGATVVRAPMDKVVYHHLKCEKHVVLVANGAAAESLLDNGDLSFFSTQATADGDEADLVALHPRLPIPRNSELLAAPLATQDDITRIRTNLVARGVSAFGYVEVAPPQVEGLRKTA